MSQPFSQSESFTGTGKGEAFLTKAHNKFGFVVRTNGEDNPGNITLEATLEASPDGNQFSTIDRPGTTDVFQITDADLQQTGTNGVTQASLFSHSFAIEVLRPAINSFSGATSVDVWVFGVGQSQRGVQFNRSLSFDP